MQAKYTRQKRKVSSKNTQSLIFASLKILLTDLTATHSDFIIIKD